MTRQAWIDRVAVVGTSFRRVGLGRLGGFVLPADGGEHAALREALGADELTFVATCNRVECYVVLPAAVRDADATELQRRVAAFFAARGAEAREADLFARAGEAAVGHLLAVASGFDSLIPGETEIAGQLRRAHARDRAAGLAGPVLERLFDRAVLCSRRVKNETALGRAPTSAAGIAVQKLRKYFGQAGPAVTVFVGAGEMTRKVAQALAAHAGERLFVNRTRARAEELAARFGGRALSLAEFLAAPPARVDLLFSATAAGETVVPAAALEPALAARRPEDGPLVVCDLGVPRDVDPVLDARPGVLVVDMRTIEALARQGEAAVSAELDKARAIVDREVAQVVREARFEQLAAESARAVLDGPLAHLSPDDQEVVRRYVVGLAARMARQPAA